MKSPRRIEGVQEWLYVVIVASLAVYLVIGILAWTWMILVGIAAPDAFTTTIAAVAGALAGIISPLHAPPVRGSDAAPTE